MEIVSHPILTFCILNVVSVTWHLYVQCHMAFMCLMSRHSHVWCHMEFLCSMSHDSHMSGVTWHSSVWYHMTCICSVSRDIPMFSITWQPYAQCHMAFMCLMSHDIHMSVSYDIHMFSVTWQPHVWCHMTCICSVSQGRHISVKLGKVYRTKGGGGWKQPSDSAQEPWAPVSPGWGGFYGQQQGSPSHGTLSVPRGCASAWEGGTRPGASLGYRAGGCQPPS